MKMYVIYFSPTGGTQKVSNFLAQELSNTSTSIDLSDYRTDFQNIALSNEDIALIAVPSYNGRVPALASARIQQIQGNGAKAILVCVYGNRAYEDTLVELQDIVKNAGFSVVAAVAAIAEHSIAHKYATNRPDQDDYKQLKEFAEKIRNKLNVQNFTEPVIPGNRPYKTISPTGIVPKATSKCTKCGLCASRCPANAIDKNDPTKVHKNACISCMRCISVCPYHARKINGFLLFIVNAMLKKACSVRKTGELYL